MKIAVVPAPGIGDGLILHIASYNLVQMGHEVTTFNDHLAGFGQWWLESYRFAKQPAIDQIETLFQKYDAIILQHDNTLKSKRLKQLDLLKFTFYGSHQISKHGPLEENDYVCDPDQTMVENLHRALKKWFHAASKENGLTPLKGLVHKKYPLRIAIHSTSNSIDRNWPQKKYDRVAEELRKLGYNPVYLNDLKGQPNFSTLESLASFLYESGFFLGNDSGPGHLASYLKIPSLIIGKNERHMRLWAPGWQASEILTPPRWSSYWKWTKNKWETFITTKRTIKILKEKVLRIN